ncbi:MAG: uroporphyrinogen decarboxylase family protein [Dehalococcoidia bacterium]|nr:uroporphyrinogen decarboxylase family protein [Dehalococcoidia bacterium]
MRKADGLRPDEMTSAERFDALFAGKPIDRIPLLMFSGYGFCARNVGYTLADMYNDAEKSVNAQVWTAEQYGFQVSPSLSYASYGAWEFGGEARLPRTEFEQAPQVKHFPVQSEEDVWKLKLPDVITSGLLPKMMELSKVVAQRGLPVQIGLGAPIMRAGNLCGVENLCRWMIKKPELVHHLVKLVTDHGVQVAQHWVDTFGADRVVAREGSATESNQMISPRHFETFALPHLKEMHEKVLAMGVKRFLNCHICGEEEMNLPFWAQLPMGDVGLVSFDHEVDLDIAIKYFGDKCVIAGNVDSTILMTGTPKQVYELCRRAIEKGKHAPRGFVLSADCETSPATPPYNVYMMRKAVDDFGWYR